MKKEVKYTEKTLKRTHKIREVYSTFNKHHRMFVYNQEMSFPRKQKKYLKLTKRSISQLLLLIGMGGADIQKMSTP